ncbi:MAG TPA: adenylate kinase [Clostridiales bacterium]|nr:adenylate kinase [Clostridiales bacterium]
MNVVFLGPPGSGKGTMAERVSVRLGLAHISTGDMLRAEIKQGSELGTLAKSYIDKGALVPDEVIIDMMKERFTKDDAKGGVLLDGFPRTVAQAQALDAIAAMDACINLEVQAQVIIDRVLARRVCNECGAVHSTKTHEGNACTVCGGALVTRADDNEETIRQRFSVYEEQTAPLIEYYRGKGILHAVDATMPIDEEANLICKILGEK